MTAGFELASRRLVLLCPVGLLTFVPRRCRGSCRSRSLTRLLALSLFLSCLLARARACSVARSCGRSVCPFVRAAVLAGLVGPTGLLGLCGSVRVRPLKDRLHPGCKTYLILVDASTKTNSLQTGENAPIWPQPSWIWLPGRGNPWRFRRRSRKSVN